MTFPSPSLFLDREGNWFCDGEAITHPRTTRLFSRSITRSPEGGYRLVIGRESCPVAVEDTPYMVRAVDFLPDRVVIMLNDETEESLDPSSLEIGDDNVLYCRVKGGYPARFLRPAYYHFTSRVEYNEEHHYHLNLNGEIFPLRPKGK